MRYDVRAFAGHSLASISGLAGSLPAGAVLGEERWENNIKYRLFYNDGGDTIPPGYMFKSKGAGQGPYSVTVTTVTESVSGVRGVCHNASSTTGTYFWGAVFGYPVRMSASNISIATGVFVGVAAAGLCVTTSTTAHYVAQNIGDAATPLSTALTQTGSGTTSKCGTRFFVFFEERAAWISD